MADLSMPGDAIVSTARSNRQPRKCRLAADFIHAALRRMSADGRGRAGRGPGRCRAPWRWRGGHSRARASTAASTARPCASPAAIAEARVQPVPWVCRLSIRAWLQTRCPVSVASTSCTVSPARCPPFSSTARQPSASSASAALMHRRDALDRVSGAGFRLPAGSGSAPRRAAPEDASVRRSPPARSAARRLWRP